MITSPVPSNCFECPMARHLYADRFACGNSPAKVVRGHFESTAVRVASALAEDGAQASLNVVMQLSLDQISLLYPQLYRIFEV